MPESGKNKVVAIDCETHMIEPGNLQPRLVCISYCDTEGADVLSWREASEFMLSRIDRGFSFVGHNIAFDLAVLMRHDDRLCPLFFQLYEEGRIHDTYIREALRLIRVGRFSTGKFKLSLDALSKKHLGEALDKSEDSWRYRYKELEEISVKDWPKEAYEYALNDAKSTYGIFRNQESSPDETLQTRAAWALHLTSVRGIRTDEKAVTALEERLRGTVEEHRQDLIDSGLVRVDKKGKLVKNTKIIRERVSKYLGAGAERTNPSAKYPEGQVKIDSNALQKTKDPELAQLIAYSETEKLLTTYIPLLKQGTTHAINARFNILVETGRTSCSKPNLQNQPRKHGVRECFVARPNHVFAACDYSSAELMALAQLCYSWFGKSEMREAILQGRDLNLDMGAQLAGLPYEVAAELYRNGDAEIEEYRQRAKFIMYGAPGGLGVDTLVTYAEGMGMQISHEEARDLRNAWFNRWPEMRAYFDRASSISDEFGSKRVVHFKSGRIRGGVRFTQACNTPFQGLVADMAKDAMWRVATECWTDKGTALFGSYPVAFIHDEIIIEVPVDKAHAAAVRLREVMLEPGKYWLPDVPIDGEVHLMARWYKKAKPVYNDRGELVPWEPARKEN